MKLNGSGEVADGGNRLLSAVRDRLSEFGVAMDVEPVAAGFSDDAIVTLSREGQRQRYSVVLPAHMTISSLMRTGSLHGTGSTLGFPALVVGDQISRRSAAALQDAQIQYIDTLGNASIRFGGVLVDVQGRQNSAAQDSLDHEADLRRPANMFSARRAQVILVLLTWPHLSNAGVRALAATAGVSAGQVHDTLGQLQQTGFLVPVSRRLERADELLDLWAAAYPTGLGRRLELASFHGDPDRSVQGLGSDRSWYLSGESARGVGVVRPMTLTVYVDDLDRMLPVRNRWDANPHRTPNIFVRRKFWTAPGAGTEGSSPEGENAPWPLVYADLRAMRDARLLEVAKDWRVRHAPSGDV